MRDDEPDVVELLIKHELAIKQLYEAFAAMFADRQGFWQALAREEQQHADSLRTLRSESTIGMGLLNRQYKAQAIKTSIGYVESQIVRARTIKLSFLQALAIARDLESALLEKQFSKISDSVPMEIRSTLLDLAAETERHRKTLVQAMENEKRKIPLPSW
jgi:rubrerythrin